MPTEYHQKNKESLLKKACERFQHLSQKEKKAFRTSTFFHIKDQLKLSS